MNNGTLVIHPKDPTTDFLSEIYENKSDWKIVREYVSNSRLRGLIGTHSRIIMLGHGTSNGLIGLNRFIIDSKFVYLLRNKQCVCVC